VTGWLRSRFYSRCRRWDSGNVTGRRMLLQPRSCRRARNGQVSPASGTPPGFARAFVWDPEPFAALAGNMNRHGYTLAGLLLSTPQDTCSALILHHGPSGDARARSRMKPWSSAPAG
jgi:hypothetical protein